MMPLTEQERRKRASQAEPAIEVNQRWIAFNDVGKVSRRLRILAPHPDGGWIYRDEPAEAAPRAMRQAYGGELGLCPEFNLRYVFELERPEATG